MARLSLVPSAHPSAWTTDDDKAEREADHETASSCAFCGQPTCGWQTPFHLNDDHADDRPANLAAGCPLCHLVQHLNRPDIEREAVLIWLPEMAQGAITILGRQIHLALVAARASPILPSVPYTGTTPAVMRPMAAYRALHERATAAELRLGTASPRALGAALLGLNITDEKRRARLLGGLRLLPRGQLFANGRDIYPDILRDWAAPRDGGIDGPHVRGAP
jgi:intracellular multiplication protein IcmJ